jgi:hypothetical protein
MANIILVIGAEVYTEAASTVQHIDPTLVDRTHTREMNKFQVSNTTVAFWRLEACS